MSDLKSDNIIMNSHSIYVKNSDIHGRGVFANKFFKEDEIIEVFPLAPLGFRTRYQGDLGVYMYCFVNDKCPCEECKRHGNVIYIGMGYSAVYNHQDQPNAAMSIDFENLVGTISAIKNIEQDKEICIKYTNVDLFTQGKVTVHDSYNG